MYACARAEIDAKSRGKSYHDKNAQNQTTRLEKMSDGNTDDADDDVVIPLDEEQRGMLSGARADPAPAASRVAAYLAKASASVASIGTSTRGKPSGYRRAPSDQ